MKQMKYDAIDIGEATIGSGMMGDVVAGVGGDAKGIFNLTKFMPQIGTIKGASATVREVRKMEKKY